MGIVSYQTDVVGQVGASPRRIKVVTTDNLATVTAAGYFNTLVKEGIALYPTDFIDIVYNFTGNINSVGSGTNAEMTLSYSAGIWTAALYVNPGNVLLPVVAGDIPVLGLTGQISDSGILLANQEVTIIATLNQAAVQGAFATPVQLVAAPGAGKVLIPTFASIYTNFQTTAFASGGVAIVQWGNTVHGAGTNSLSATIPAAEITASASQVYNLNGNTGNALTAISNLGIFFSNQTGAFTLGNAASTVVITLTYIVSTATV